MSVNIISHFDENGADFETVLEDAIRTALSARKAEGCVWDPGLIDVSQDEKEAR